MINGKHRRLDLPCYLVRNNENNVVLTLHQLYSCRILFIRNSSVRKYPKIIQVPFSICFCGQIDRAMATASAVKYISFSETIIRYSSLENYFGTERGRKMWREICDLELFFYLNYRINFRKDGPDRVRTRFFWNPRRLIFSHFITLK